MPTKLPLNQRNRKIAEFVREKLQAIREERDFNEKVCDSIEDAFRRAGERPSQAVLRELSLMCRAMHMQISVEVTEGTLKLTEDPMDPPEVAPVAKA
jgi:hypothetical protein